MFRTRWIPARVNPDIIPVMQKSVWTQRIHEPFLVAALAIALTAGFGYAALLAAALGMNLPLGLWWGAAIQAHGHAQLFGWMGMFILGMALFFLPRLRGVRLTGVGFARWGFALLTGGIVLRSIAQPALGFADPASMFQSPIRAGLAVSSLLELAGMLAVAIMLIKTGLSAGELSNEAPAYPVLPFIRIAVASFASAFIANTIGTLITVYRGRVTLEPGWDSLVVDLMLYGLAIPMAVVFSVRNFPLFLRLAIPPREHLRSIAFGYLVGLLLRLAPGVVSIAVTSSQWVNILGAVGVIIDGVCVLVFIWMIDLLRRRPPWTVNRAPNTRPELEYLRKPTRPRYPDAGEYGRFELLLYSSYVWLIVSSLTGIIRSAGLLLGYQGIAPPDAERHALTVGFITMLIFGMAPRMVPGFSGKRRVASSLLVFLTFIFGNLAALLRTLPLLLPGWNWAGALLASSGAIGWVAVACLGINLVRTLRTRGTT